MIALYIPPPTNQYKNPNNNHVVFVESIKHDWVHCPTHYDKITLNFTTHDLSGSPNSTCKYIKQIAQKFSSSLHKLEFFFCFRLYNMTSLHATCPPRDLCNFKRHESHKA